MLRRLRIQARLWLAFGIILAMTALLVAVGGFGLNVSQKAIQGITQKLIPTSNITVAARSHLLQSKTATSTLVASIFNKEGMARARKEWDGAQAGLDKAMDDFGKMTTEALKNLVWMHRLLVGWRLQKKKGYRLKRRKEN